MAAPHAGRWRAYREPVPRKRPREPAVAAAHVPAVVLGLTATDVAPESCMCVVWNGSLFTVFRGGLYCLILPDVGANPARPVGGWMKASVDGDAPTGMLAAGAVFNSQLVVHGGVDATGCVTGEMHAVNLSSTGRAWTRVCQLPAHQDAPPDTDTAAHFPVPVCHHTLTLVQGRGAVLLHGGVTDLRTPALTDATWEFSLPTQRWRPLAPSGVPRSGHSACIWENTLLVTGGVDDTNTLCWTVQALCLEANVWQTIAAPSPLAQQVLLSPMVTDLATGTVWWSGGAQLLLAPQTNSTSFGTVSGTFSSMTSYDSMNGNGKGNGPVWKLFSTALLPNLNAAAPWATASGGADGGVVWYVQERELWMFKTGVWICRAIAGAPPLSQEAYLERQQPQLLPHPPEATPAVEAEGDEELSPSPEGARADGNGSPCAVASPAAAPARGTLVVYGSPQGDGTGCKGDAAEEAGGSVLDVSAAAKVPTRPRKPNSAPAGRGARGASARTAPRGVARHLHVASAGRKARFGSAKAHPHHPYAQRAGSAGATVYAFKAHTTNLAKRVISSTLTAAGRGGDTDPAPVPIDDSHADDVAAADDPVSKTPVPPAVPCEPQTRLDTTWARPTLSAVASRLMELKSDSLVLDLSGIPLTSADVFHAYSVLRSHPSVRKVSCAHVPFLDTVSSKAVLTTVQENKDIIVWSFEGTAFECKAHKAMIEKQLAVNEARAERKKERRAKKAQTKELNAVLRANRSAREQAWTAKRERADVEHDWLRSGLHLQQQGMWRMLRLHEECVFGHLQACEAVAYRTLVHCIALREQQQEQRAALEAEEDAQREDEHDRRFSELRLMKSDEKREKRLVHELLLRRAKQHRTERDGVFSEEKEMRVRVRDVQDAEFRELQSRIDALNARAAELRKLERLRVEEEARKRADEEARARREAERKRRAQEELEKRHKWQLQDLAAAETRERSEHENDMRKEFFAITTTEWEADVATAREMEKVGCAERELAALELEPPRVMLDVPEGLQTYICANSPTVLNRPLAACRIWCEVPVPQHLREGVTYEHNTETWEEIQMRRDVIDSGTIYICIRPDRSWGGVGAEVHVVDVLESQRKSMLRVHGDNIYFSESYEGVSQRSSVTNLSPLDRPQAIKRRRGSVHSPTGGEVRGRGSPAGMTRQRSSSVVSLPSLPHEPAVDEGRLVCRVESLSPDLAIDEFESDYLGVLITITRQIPTSMLQAVFDLVTLTLPYGSVTPGTRFSLDVDATLLYAGTQKRTSEVYVINLDAIEMPFALSEKSSSKYYTEGSGKMRLFRGAHVSLKRPERTSSPPTPAQRTRPTGRRASIRGLPLGLPTPQATPSSPPVMVRSRPASPEGPPAEYMLLHIHCEGLGREDRIVLDGGSDKGGAYRIKSKGWIMERREREPAGAAQGATPAPRSLTVPDIASGRHSPSPMQQALAVPDAGAAPASPFAVAPFQPEQTLRALVLSPMAPPPPKYSSCTIEVRKTYDDVRSALAALMFLNEDNNPETNCERLIYVCLEEPAAGFPAMLGVIRIQIMGTDDPSVVDFGVFVPSWRQVGRDVQQNLQEFLPPQPNLRFGVLGYIADVDTTTFHNGHLTISITHGGNKGDTLVVELHHSQTLYMDDELPNEILCDDESVATMSYPKHDMTCIKFTFGETGATIERASELFRSVALRVEGKMPQKEGRHVSIQAEFQIGDVTPVRTSRTFRVTPPLLTNPSSHATIIIREGAGKVPLSTKFEVLENDDGWDGGSLLVEVIEGGTDDDCFSLFEKHGFKMREIERATPFGSTRTMQLSVDPDADAAGDDENDKSDAEREGGCTSSFRPPQEVKAVLKSAVMKMTRDRSQRFKALLVGEIEKVMRSQEEAQRELHRTHTQDSLNGEEMELMFHDAVVGRVVVLKKGMLIVFDCEPPDKVKACVNRDKAPSRREFSRLKRLEIQKLLRSIAYQNHCQTSQGTNRKVVRVQLNDGLAHSSYTLHELFIEPVDTATELMRVDPTQMRAYHQGCPGDVNGFLMFEDCYLRDPDTFCFNGGRIELSLFSGASEASEFEHTVWLQSLNEQIDNYNYLQAVMSPKESRKSSGSQLSFAEAHPAVRRRSRAASAVGELRDKAEDNGEVFKGTGVDRLCTVRRRNAIFDPSLRSYIIRTPDGRLYHRVGLPNPPRGRESSSGCLRSARRGSVAVDALLMGATELGRCVQQDRRLVIELVDLPDHISRPESTAEAANVTTNISLEMVEDLLYAIAYRNVCLAAQFQPYYITYQLVLDAGPNSVAGKSKLQFKICGPTLYVPGRLNNAVVEYVPGVTTSPLFVSPKMRTQWTSSSYITRGTLVVTLEGSMELSRDYIKLAIEGTAFKVHEDDPEDGGRRWVKHGATLIGELTSGGPRRITIEFCAKSCATGSHVQQLLRLVGYCYAPPTRHKDNYHRTHERETLDNVMGLSANIAWEESERARTVSFLFLTGSPDTSGTVESEIYLCPFRRTAALCFMQHPQTPPPDPDLLAGSLNSHRSSIPSLSGEPTYECTYRTTSAPVRCLKTVKISDTDDGLYEYPSYVEVSMDAGVGDMLYSSTCGLLANLDDAMALPGSPAGSAGGGTGSLQDKSRSGGTGSLKGKPTDTTQGVPVATLANMTMSQHYAHIVDAHSDMHPKWYRHLDLPPCVFSYEPLATPGKVGFRVTLLSANQSEVEDLIHSTVFFNAFTGAAGKSRMKNVVRTVNARIHRARAIEGHGVCAEITLKPPYFDFPPLRDGVARIHHSAASRFLQNPTITDLGALSGASLNVKLHVCAAGIPFSLTLIDERSLPAMEVTVPLGKKPNPETVRRFCSAIQLKSQAKAKARQGALGVIRVRVANATQVLLSMHVAVVQQAARGE